jgi:hypothetical protein
MSHLLLQLENTKHQRLSRRRTAWNINVDGNNTITSSSNRVGIMIIATSIGARAHGNNPARVRHLIVDLTESGGHFVGEGAGDNHYVGLTGRGAENDAHAVLVVARGGQVHHFYGAAGEAEGHGPEGALASPVGDLIEGGAVVEEMSIGFKVGKVRVSYSAYCMTPCLPS